MKIKLTEEQLFKVSKELEILENDLISLRKKQEADYLSVNPWDFVYFENEISLHKEILKNKYIDTSDLN